MEMVFAIERACQAIEDAAPVRVAILTGEGEKAVAVPRDAIIHEGESARVWVTRENDTSIELRQVKLGMANGSMVEVVEGLGPSDRVITKGSLFIDRVVAAATGS
jgi:cobalt-zinc-cadmium efflux system membrane fusion protein